MTMTKHATAAGTFGYGVTFTPSGRAGQRQNPVPTMPFLRSSGLTWAAAEWPLLPPTDGSVDSIDGQVTVPEPGDLDMYFRSRRAAQEYLRNFDSGHGNATIEGKSPLSSFLETPNAAHLIAAAALQPLAKQGRTADTFGAMLGHIVPPGVVGPALRRGAEFLFTEPGDDGGRVVSVSRTIKTVTTAVTVYKSAKKFKEFMYDGFLTPVSAELFTSIENPLCTYCRPELKDLKMPNSVASARFACPSRCGLCSRFPGLYGFDACTISIDATAHQVLNNFSELKKVKDSRDVHGPLVNGIDSRVAQDFNLHLFQPYLPKVVALQRRKVHWFDNAFRGLLVTGATDGNNALTIGQWTKTITYCGLFKAITNPAQPAPPVLLPPPGLPLPPGASGALPASASGPGATSAALGRLRQIWDFVSRHGSYPVTTVLDGPRTILDRLTGRPTPDMSVHAQLVEEQAELNPAASPGPGETSGFVQHEAACVTGPISVPTTILNPVHVSHGVEVRTQVQNDPRYKDADGNPMPLRFDPNSETGRLYKKFWKRINDELFTTENILKTYNKIMGDKQLGEYGISKFSTEQVNDAMQFDQLIRDPSEILMRKSNGKWETIDKDKKTVRAVVDNHLELLAMVHVPAEIYSEIMFGEDSPFHTMNIKHRDRKDVLDEFVRFNSLDTGEDMLMWEVDQTSMEAHMRVYGADQKGFGPLSPILAAMKRIATVCSQKFSGQLGTRYSMKISYDIQKGMRISIEVHGVTLPGSTKKVTLKFPDFYLDSGWALTSAANFSGEVTMTMCCFTIDPWHIFARDKDGKFRINTGSFDYTFNSRPFPTANGAPWTPKRIKFTDLTEGDDAGGSVSRSICYDDTPEAIEAVKTQLTYYMADGGMSAKFVLQKNGRIEIIGAHMKCINGRCDPTFPWCPAVKRYMGKIGCAAQGRQPNTDEGRTILAASRLISIGSMFQGNLEMFNRAFNNLALHHYRKLSKAATEKEYRVYAWSAEEMAGLEAGITTLKATFEAMELKGAAVSYPQACTQELMIMNSLQINEFGHNVMGKLDIWAQDMLDWDGDHEAYYRQLPDIFK